MAGHVILLHGLWMRAYALGALRRRLGEAGFVVNAFDYASVFVAPEVNIGRLIAYARRLGARAGVDEIHFVCHSLGGLIALHALKAADLAPGRVVCLGSPLRGSAVARRLRRWPGGPVLVGKSIGMLMRGLDDHWLDHCAREVGAIAGTVPVGLGKAAGVLTRPHDGTVSVEETRLPGLTDHCLVPTSHSGLLFSAEAAAKTVAFLRDGRFA
jgi:pimeloyl-ACP methyl ester carboxylesterase